MAEVSFFWTAHFSYVVSLYRLVRYRQADSMLELEDQTVLLISRSW